MKFNMLQKRAHDYYVLIGLEQEAYLLRLLLNIHFTTLSSKMNLENIYIYSLKGLKRK